MTCEEKVAEFVRQMHQETNFSHGRSKIIPSKNEIRS